MAPGLKVAAAAGTTSRGGAPNDARDKRADAQFERDLVALIPHLQNFSHMLCRRGAIAEDIVQDALAKAWRARDRFEPGTNLKAWLFTILRHELYSHKRREWRHAPWDETSSELIPVPADEQEWAMNLSDCLRALGQLPDSQREVLLLVGAGGFSYGDAANLLGAPVGTLKSRLARGRGNLEQYLSSERSLQDRSKTLAGCGVGDVVVQMAAVGRHKSRGIHGNSANGRSG